MNFFSFRGTLRTLPVIVLAAICVALYSFSGFSISSAQTNTAPKPTPTPTPIEDDDGPIEIKSDLVNLSIRVVDRNNKPVGVLNQGDFKIFEDNVEQPIEFFSREEVPVNYVMVVDNSNSLRPQLEK